jgi:integrase
MKNIKSVIRKNLKTISNEHLIYLRYTYNRKYVLFRTDVYVLYRNWNSSAGRVRKSFNYEKLNTILEKIENELYTLILDLRIKNIEPTLLNVRNEYYKIKNHFQQDVSGPRKISETRFITDFQEFIYDREKKKQVEPDTIKTYKTTLNKLSDFKKKNNYFLHYDNINEDFYFDFVNYLRYDVGLLDNSLDKHIKNIKLFMNYSFEKKQHTNQYYRAFKRTKNKTQFVVLNRRELIQLAYNYKPEPGSLKDKVRDTFIFGCSTGLRFSDLTELKRGNFVIERDGMTNKILDNAGSTYIKLVINKTQEYLKLPINNFIFDLIKKYDIENKEITFLKHNNQIFNRTIKEICKEAGITEAITITKRKGRENIDYDEQKYKFISSHTMRRTFITSMSSATEITNVQAVSGHKDIKVLTDYIKRNDKELNIVKENLNDIFYQKDEEMIGDKSIGLKTRIIVKE